MNVRRAAADDFDAIAELWREFDHEVPPPTHEGPADEEKELGEIARDHRVRDRVRRGGRRRTPVGFALARRRGVGLRDADRPLRRSRCAAQRDRDGAHARGPRRRFASSGSRNSTSTCRRRTTSLAPSTRAGGFKDDVVVMTGSVAALEERLGAQEAASFGSIHIQSDDLSAVEQAVRQFVPQAPRRLARLARRAAAWRLDRRLRRRLRPQPGDAPAARARALRQDGRRDACCSASSARSSCG